MSTAARTSDHVDCGPSHRQFSIIRPKWGEDRRLLFPVGFGFAAYTHWDGERTVFCTSREHCELCVTNGPPRVSSWHYVYTTQRVVQILALPRVATKQLQEMDVETGGLDNAIVSVTRRTSAKGPVVLEFIQRSQKAELLDFSHLRPLRDVISHLMGR